MFQRDYVLRMIEMMGEFMRRVKDLMDEHSQLRLLDRACHQNCGLPLDTLEALSAESLCQLLAPTPCFVASELLYCRATNFTMPAEAADERLLKSLRLLASLKEEGPLCELRAPRLREMKARLLPMLTAEDLMLCAEFFAQAEAYADMEDALFQAVDIARVEELPGDIAVGEALLQKAAKASEQALALAFTSGRELREAARELAARADIMKQTKG
ncbi:MAG: DUF6483 family protein [Clostridia bacterium]